MNSYFICRDHCPACASPNFKEIYKNRFTEPPISDYLKSFYSAQGKIEFEYSGRITRLLSARRAN